MLGYGVAQAFLFVLHRMTEALPTGGWDAGFLAGVRTVLDGFWALNEHLPVVEVIGMLVTFVKAFLVLLGVQLVRKIWHEVPVVGGSE